MPKGTQLVSGRIWNPGQSDARVLALVSYVTVIILDMEQLRFKELSELASVTELKVPKLEP